MPVKINLIVWNPGLQALGMRCRKRSGSRPSAAPFTECGVAAFLRRPRGRDIDAACGQLKRTVAQRLLLTFAPPVGKSITAP